MKTTSIVAEQIVAGSLFITWLLLLVFDPEEFLDRIQIEGSVGTTEIISLGFVSLIIVYIAGVISDRISDLVIANIFGWLPGTKFFSK